jgi:hypothetical protein
MKAPDDASRVLAGLREQLGAKPRSPGELAEIVVAARNQYGNVNLFEL